jgi:two-component sensor histidine kinase
LHEEENRILARFRRGEHVSHYETVRVTRDGRRVDISLSTSPLRDRSGKVIGTSTVARDITERKEGEKLQRLLVEELNHRIKNTLATIQSIASQSLRRAKNPTDFVSGFTGRVRALARAHDLLTQTKLQGAELIDLIREQVLIGSADDNRITYSGPNLMLDAQASMHVGLVLHELATNARKYGALSVPNGQLSITWEISSNGERNLILNWLERGGPKITVPRQRGFGSTLIERTLKGHGGDASIRFTAEGLTGRFTLPLPAQLQPNIGMQAASFQYDKMPLLHAVDEERNLKGKRIIIIEDEPLISMELEDVLTAAGCEVSGTAGNLVEARELSTNVECDAALVDVNLAGQPVDELVSTLTKRKIPFAFVSGFGRETLPQGFREAVLLRKPFSQHELVAVVELLLYQAPGVVQLRRR